MPVVLHISSHMGGGVGKVLSGISIYSRNREPDYDHRILLLEEPKNPYYFNKCLECDIEIAVAHHFDQIKQEMEKADIVQLEWWHHPLMADFLHRFPKIPVRLVIWSHISGCTYPFIAPEFVLKPHKFLFTSKYSLENSFWTSTQKEEILRRSAVINSSGGFDLFLNTVSFPHKGFNIGYVGTLGYEKLHPDFLKFCMEIDIPDARFIIIGDLPEPNVIETQVKNLSMKDKFIFQGHVSDLAWELSHLDVFGYLLNPEHYGTTENALLESMAAGLPVVALDQCAEKYLIRHMETGILIHNYLEYKKAIRYLYENPKERIRLGSNARKYVLSELDLPITVKKLHSVYDHVLRRRGKTYLFDDIFGKKPHQWFLSGLTTERKYFTGSMDRLIRRDPKKLAEIEKRITNSRTILKGQSKSSITQFHNYFPKDRWLAYWHRLIYNGDNNCKEGEMP